MCYYNGCRVTRTEYIRLKGIEKELRGLNLIRPVQKGFDYRDWPIVKPTIDRKSFSVELAHWEFIPKDIGDEFELKGFRKSGIPWFNAQAEHLFKNNKGEESKWAEAAIEGRCLVLSSYFFEFRHLPMIGKKGQVLKQTRKVPYCITLKEKPFGDFFFMAGIWRQWTNVTRGQSAPTFAIVTQAANNFMASVHNSAKRMPMILPDEESAVRWIKGGQTQMQVEQMSRERLASSKMIGWPVAPNFLSKENPEEPYQYDDVPDLIFDGENEMP